VRDNVRILGETVLKKGDPGLMRIEVEKSIRGHEIGRESGLFRVPQILDYDESKGEVVLERIADIRAVRHAVSFDKQYGDVLERVGVALAMIHRKLELPKGMVEALPDEFVLRGNEVFLHGDFSINNVCVGNESPTIVILDWQMTKVHGGKATYGTRYFDLVWFVNNLFSKPFHNYLPGPPVGRGARRFLAGYLGACDVSFSVREFAAYMKQFYRTKLALRRQSLAWNKRLQLAPGHIFWRMFIDSVASDNEICG